jgi:hypothetical protein
MQFPTLKHFEKFLNSPEKKAELNEDVPKFCDLEKVKMIAGNVISLLENGELKI